MSTQIGLYFPFFHFPDDGWVKLAALYWDKMYRIVPHKYETHDSLVVNKLMQGDSPFIDNIHPEDQIEILEEIKVAFITLIENHTDELIKYYGIHNINNWPIDPYTAEHSKQGGDPRLAFLHSYKLEGELRDLILTRGLGTLRSDSGEDYQWVGMHPRFLNVYMAALAEKLANRPPFSANPLTNDPINYCAVGGFTFERLAQVLLDNAKIVPKKISKDEVESRLAIIAIKGVMPKNIQGVEVEKIFALREAHAGEFGQFQELVQSVANGIPNLEEADAGPFVNDYLEAEYKKKIKPKLDKLEDSLRSLGLETVPATFSLDIKIPPLLAGIGATVINPILGATATIAFGLLKVFSDRRKAMEKTIENSDVAYLLQVKEELAPINTLEWLRSRARKVMLGV